MLGRAIERTELEAENVALRRQLLDRYQFENIIGRSRKMRELFDLVAAVADSEANILIQGENGTGKELIANAIHYNSRRVKGPFIKINCAAIPKDLIEAELFGHRRGAFTGAIQDRDGLLEQAQGGSLLLDEIGEMPPYLQTKLLARAAGARVPARRQRPCRPRGLPAHLRDQRRSGRRAQGRPDPRRSVLPHQHHRAARAAGARAHRRHPAAVRPFPRSVPAAVPAQRADHRAVGVSPADPQPVARATCASWRTRMERAVLVAKGSEITPADLPETLREDSGPGGDVVLPPHRTLAEIERMAILQALERTNWNKQEAAAQLGLYRPTLYSKMRKHKIRDEGRGRRVGHAHAAGQPRHRGARRWRPTRRPVVRDRTAVLIGLVAGAVAGGVAGWLLLTDDGRRVRARLEPRLQDLASQAMALSASAKRLQVAARAGRAGGPATSPRGRPRAERGFASPMTGHFPRRAHLRRWAGALAGRARRIASLSAQAAWRGFTSLYNSDDLTHSASIAYYALLSLFPFPAAGRVGARRVHGRTSRRARRRSTSCCATFPRASSS